jgi:hypothetical protein
MHSPWDRALLWNPSTPLRTAYCRFNASSPLTRQPLSANALRCCECLPYFMEHNGCGICASRCPHTRPEVRPKLLARFAPRESRALAAIETRGQGSCSPQQLAELDRPSETSLGRRRCWCDADTYGRGWWSPAAAGLVAWPARAVAARFARTTTTAPTTTGSAPIA